jgi:hypothetical protein
MATENINQAYGGSAFRLSHIEILALPDPTVRQRQSSNG